MSTICELVQKKTGARWCWNLTKTGTFSAEITVANLDAVADEAPVRIASSLPDRRENLRPAIGPVSSASCSDTRMARFPSGAALTDKFGSPNTVRSALFDRPRCPSAYAQ